jgi:segregation and condensation protein A
LADYRVNLDIFAGPLDLLLYLVRKEEVDIYDIPISKITNQYIRYLEMLKGLDIDLAGDFLVMAATLMHIKSVMLLPQAEPDQLQDDDFADPRTELIRQLLEYKKFKDAANLLSAAADQQKQRYQRGDTVIEQLNSGAEQEIDIEQVGIWDLLAAFDSILAATGANVDISHIKDDTPIDLYQIEILHRLQTEGPATFERIFESRTNRLMMIGLFLALLELIREKLVWIEQPKASSALYLRPLTDEPAEQAVQNAIRAADETDSRRSVQTQRQEQQPIPISELPPKKSKSKVAPTQQQQPHIPISEVPAKKNRLAVSPDENEPEKGLTAPAEDQQR